MKQVNNLVAALLGLLLVVGLIIGLLTALRPIRQPATGAAPLLPTATPPLSGPLPLPSSTPIPGPTRSPSLEEIATKDARLSWMNATVAALNATVAARPSQAAMTQTPWPTSTPLPPIPSGHREGLWAENLAFGAPIAFGIDLKDPFGRMGWSPDGKQLAISRFSGQFIHDATGKAIWEVTWITLVDATTRHSTELTQGFHPYWSPDGNHIAYLAYIDTLDLLHVRVINIRSRQVIEVTAIGKGRPFPMLSWISSSELAYYEDKPVVFNLLTSQTQTLLDATLLAQADPNFPLNFITAAPSAGVIAVGSGREILLLERIQGVARLISRIDDGVDTGLELSPDGQLLAYVSMAQVRIAGTYDPSILVKLPLSGRGSPFIGNWAFDVTSLLFHDSEGAKIVNRDGSGLRKLPAVMGGFGRLLWSPRGDQIVWVDKDLQVLTLTVTRLR